MLSIHTNATSVNTQNVVNYTNRALTNSMTKLGTGFRINSAMDDAAGLQIASRINTQIGSMKVAQKNTQNGISMMQVAEGAMNELTNILYRMKDLATEAATDSTSKSDRESMQAEYDALGKELGNIVKNTSYAGGRVFEDIKIQGKDKDGKVTEVTKEAMLNKPNLTFQIGADEKEVMVVDVKTKLDNMKKSLKEVSALFEDVGQDGKPIKEPGTELGTDKTDSARQMFSKVDDAVAKIGEFRAQLGAASNRLNHTYNNLANMVKTAEVAKGRIMDVDYASETAQMTNQQILMQTSTSMLKQANGLSHLVSALLQ